MKNINLSHDEVRLSRLKKMSMINTLDRMSVATKEVIKKNIKEWESKGSRGTKPSQMAVILDEFIQFLIIGDPCSDSTESIPLSYYVQKEGIYKRDPQFIINVILELEPDYSTRQINESLLKLRSLISRKYGTVELNNDKHILPLNNGVYNKNTRELEPFTPEYIFNSKISTNYIENAPKPKIKDFDVDEWLGELANNDNQVIQLLWEMINEVLNINATRNKAFFIVGSGNNGKGTFQDLLSELVGNHNVASLKAHKFQDRFSLHQLIGKALVIGDDVPPESFAEDLSDFKSIVTGDYISVERKNHDEYRCRLTPMIIQSTNGMIRSLDKTNGLLRRLVIVPFLADFNNKKENIKIKQEYIKDKKVLEYILFSALSMEDFDKFTIPDISKMELEKFKMDNDSVYEFAINVMLKWDYKYIPKSIAFEVYKFYCDINGYKALSSGKLHRQLKEHLTLKGWTDDSKHMSQSKTESACPLDEYLDKNGITGNLDFGIKKPKTYRVYVNPNSQKTDN